MCFLSYVVLLAAHKGVKLGGIEMGDPSVKVRGKLDNGALLGFFDGGY
jgi:hypothetical protein